jgi:hypothetical protein
VGELVGIGKDLLEQEYVQFEALDPQYVNMTEMAVPLLRLLDKVRLVGRVMTRQEARGVLLENDVAWNNGMI